MKLMTILGTRPEIIRLSAILKKADKYFDHVIVHTGQNYDYELNAIFFEELEIRKPDYFLECVGKNLGETLGGIFSKSYEIILKEKPDAILILGDTNSSLAAIAAKRLKVPVFHMEAGNRCWDWNVPEMINRKIVDHISDINLPYTENSRRYLINEGIDPKTIFVTGSPLYEVLNEYKEKIDNCDVLKRLNLKKKQYILLSAHREENIDIEKNFEKLMSSVEEVAKKYDMPIVYSMHPRSKKWVEKRGHQFPKNVIAHKPFGLVDYCSLQKNAYCVLSDSGTLSEESAMLDFPGVLIRTSTERPEALDEGSIVIGGIEKGNVIEALELAVKMHKAEGKQPLHPSYLVNNVSSKVLKIIQSYAKIVNITTWLKDE